MNRAYIYIIGVWALLLLVMAGCKNANLDLCYDEHPHRGQLIVEYDWTGLDYEKPDSMVVMAVRPVFRSKMASNWATTIASGENRLYGRLIAPFGLDFSKPMNYEEGDTDSEEDGNTDSEVDSDTEIGVDGDAEGEVEDGTDNDVDISTDPDTEDEGSNVISERRDWLYLTSGEWEISSYTSNESTLNLASVYATDVKDDNTNFYFKLETFTELPEKYSYWYDRNAYSSWVSVSSNSTVCLARGKVVVDEFANTQKDYKVVLRPVSVAQKVNISFDAELVDDDIEVDSIVAAISGIAGMMNLSTMELDINTTYQGIFKTELTENALGHITSKSTIHVPGLVRSSSGLKLQGPGILNVSVFVKYTDDKGLKHQRRLDGTLNLYGLLTETPSVKYDEDNRVVQACSVLNLDINSRMLISKDKLSNAHDAIDNWVDETIIDANTDKYN
jgi:hypothetical protein